MGNALQVANVNGVDGHAGIKTDYSNFAPRVGFSASLTPTTVLRGGYGLSFFPGNYTSNADLKNAPFTSVYSPNCQSTHRCQHRGGQQRPWRAESHPAPALNLPKHLRRRHPAAHPAKHQQPGPLLHGRNRKLPQRPHPAVQPANRAAVRRQRTHRRLCRQHRSAPARNHQRHQRTQALRSGPQPRRQRPAALENPPQPRRCRLPAERRHFQLQRAADLLPASPHPRPRLRCKLHLGQGALRHHRLLGRGWRTQLGQRRPHPHQPDRIWCG